MKSTLTKEVKYLGVILDNKLMWKMHVESDEKGVEDPVVLLCIHWQDGAGLPG